MLTVGGQLDARIGGSTIRSGTPNDYDYQHEGGRRAIYWPVFRNSLPDIFEVFDFANPSMVTGRRDISSTAPQALFMMNNPWVLQQAEQAAVRFLELEEMDESQRVQLAMRTTLGRPATEEELRVTLEFLEAEGNDPETRQLKWSQFVQALFSSLDFRYNH
jgi:hypothetical protein